jgi:catechol 2,3-dioxygenase-like lactoylglutathione lyase family enzyme
MNLEQSSSIVAPAMRFVPVSNLEASLAFYSERLGFVEQELQEDYGMNAAAEMALGQARIQLCPRQPSENVEPKILFFETENVSDFYESVQQRGARPSAVQKVNWIKMEMFEVRDPDGNTIWFGQSFQEPDKERPRPMVRQFLPHLPVDHVPAAVRYYTDVLGFSIDYADDKVGVIHRDRVTLLLIQRTEAHTGIGSCSAYIENADQLHAELLELGANVLGSPVSRPWGLRDFTIADQEGNRITFAQPFE